MKQILVTGGTGYIGSHTALELISTGYEPILVDNLSNSNRKVIDSIQKITSKKVKFYEGDLKDNNLLKSIFSNHEIHAVMHFAGLKAVGESVEKPLHYFDANIVSTIELLKEMNKAEVKKIVFSSSATVYGNPISLPIDESHPVRSVNPYGSTKLIIENILNDLTISDKQFSAVCLRYFNPIGAHESGEIGDNPNNVPNNLLPYISSVATGKSDFLRVFGNDYETIDGTGVRDYIHVIDLAKGHIAAVKFLDDNYGWEAFNLGTGQGFSVLEILKSYEESNHLSIPYKIYPRRKGDVSSCYADSSKANKILNWHAERDLKDMCISSHKFAIKNQQKI